MGWGSSQVPTTGTGLGLSDGLEEQDRFFANSKECGACFPVGEEEKYVPAGAAPSAPPAVVKAKGRSKPGH